MTQRVALRYFFLWTNHFFIFFPLVFPASAGVRRCYSKHSGKPPRIGLRMVHHVSDDAGAIVLRCCVVLEAGFILAGTQIAKDDQENRWFI